MAYLYRVLTNLDAGKRGIIAAGSLSRLEWLDEDNIARLVGVGAVAPASTPPLAVLPGWKTRAEKLARQGCSTVEAFLQHDVDALAAGMGVKRETIERWQSEALSWLSLPPRSG